MHPSLLIDEILREIFQWCAVSGGHDLPRTARTCRAWKDPALDALYNHITSLKPLLALLPASSENAETFLTAEQLQTFHSYAWRVKHLAHSTRDYVGLDPHSLLLSALGDSDQCLPACIFPRLQTAKITLPSRTTCGLPVCMSLSSDLRELQIDEGFNARKTQNRTSDYLRHAAAVAPRLESLTIRGLISSDTNRQLAGMSNLRSLRLRTAHTLSVDTFASIAAFPQLEVVEIHAREIAATDVDAIWSSYPSVPLFPSIQNIWIRCTPDLFALVARKIESTQLHTLYLDLETPNQTTPFWHTLFDNIRKPFASTLQELSIMHLLDHDDAASARDIHDANTIGLKDLRPLSHCRNIRRLDFGTTFPANLCDSDFAHMVSWWPQLESLELSSEITNDQATPTPRVTYETLRVISTSLPKLTYLAIPVDTSGITEETIEKLDVAGNRTLKTLSIMFPHLPDTTLLPRYLYTLFPDLPEVEYSSEQWFADWVKVTSGVRGLQLQCDTVGICI